MKNKDIAATLKTHNSSITRIKKGDRGITLSMSLKIVELIGGNYSDYHGKSGPDAEKIFEKLPQR